ncbi:MAG: hypothetical protein DKINENOH_02401 [bacterium]|nr:hypothetical protein [bacterium]
MHKVFISYSHDSREHADRVLALADRLVQDGVDCVLDQYEESPAEGWTRWMDRQIRSAEFVLMIFTEIYGRRVNGEEEPAKGLGVKWEGKLIYQHLYQADANTRFIPVVFAPEHTQFISTPLQDATYYLVSDDEGYEKLYRRLTHKPQTQKPKLGTLRQLPPRERKQDFFIAPKIQTAKLPTTASELFGREKELKLLDAAWADEHTHLLSLVAWGGVGKSALVNEWLGRLERENFRGAERVFGWSFYSQGTREERNVSADSFFDEALRWFGHSGPAILSPWDKGIRLAELLRQQKTLLILDGVEPLQYPPGQLQGELKDQGLKALLKELARANLGLCVVTTRVALQDISHTEGKTSRRVDLENLSPEAGSQLLRHLQVKGTDKELAAASREFGGHALALNLLGRYLAVVHEGEVRKRDLIPHLTEEEKQGGHARRVMESYERWLAGKPECDILHLMGLFDRPAAKGAIAALLAQPAIKGLTSNLQNLPLAQLQFAFQHLRDLRLLAEKDTHRPDTLDCHPLVREHFGEKLRQQNPAAWKEAHGRLYEYYKNLPAKELPDTLEEMEPLFAAVAHGCQAGQHQGALADVYYSRIQRDGRTNYCCAKLGAFGADLSAVSNFFEILWSQPASGLTDADKAVVLSWAGFRLRALGRLAEASQPMQAGMEMRVKQKNWEGAAKNAGNLSELYLTLGEVSQAVASARQSVDFADRSGDGFQKYSKRTTLADALHQAGELTEAQKLFREAEAMQKQSQPEYPYLYSLRGFQFCDLLLSQGQYQEVQKRADKTLQWEIEENWLLDIALDKLSLGRAFLLQALAETTARALGAPGQYFDQARGYLQQAVAGLREAGHQEFIGRGLFARAAFHRSQNEFALAWADLEEAHEIAERGGMKLFLAEYHLEACRLQVASGKLQEAKEHLETAAKMIEEMGYGRRKPEVEALRREIEALKI